MAVTNQRPPSTCRVVLVIGVALVESLLFSGVSYGVVSLTPMLDDRKVYAHLCVNSTAVGANASDRQGSCTALQDQVTLAFTVTQVVTPFGNLASGLILDRLGFRAVKAAAATLFGLGCLCFTLAQPGVDWLIFPGTMMLGISGIQVIICNLQLAPMVKIPFVVASLVSGLFDACTMVTSTLVLIVKGGVNSFAAFGVYTGLGVATIVLTIVIYPGKYNQMAVELESKEASNGSLQQQQQQQQQEKPHGVDSSHLQQQQTTEVKDELPQPEVQQAPPLSRQLLSTDFILMIVWMICNNLRLNYFFGSLNAYVDVITGSDKEQREHYSTLFGYFFLTSPLISLVPGALLDLQKRFIPMLRENTRGAYKLNTVTTLSLTGILGATSCLMLFTNATGMLIPAFVAIAIHRAFLFSTLGNYCISVFSPEYFGIVYTSIICTAAPFMFLTVPITNFLKESRNSNLVNGILAGLCCASLVHPLTLLLRNLRDAERKQVKPMTNELDWKTEL